MSEEFNAAGQYARHRIDAAIGERRRHHRKIARGDQDGALPEIGVQHRIDVVLQHQVIPQQPCDRAIAVSSQRFGCVHGVVDAKLAPGKLAEFLADTLERVSAVRLMDQA